MILECIVVLIIKVDEHYLVQIVVRTTSIPNKKVKEIQDVLDAFDYYRGDNVFV